MDMEILCVIYYCYGLLEALGMRFGGVKAWQWAAEDAATYLYRKGLWN